VKQLLVAGGLVSLLSGCASIVSGTSQSLSVEARTESGTPVVGANCKLENPKGVWFVTTPGSVTIHRAYDDLAVQCTKDGEHPGHATVKSSTKGMAFGNILFGGAIGAGVDMASGAAYDYPALITVQMGSSITIPDKPATPLPAQGAASPVPSVALAAAQTQPAVSVPARPVVFGAWTRNLTASEQSQFATHTGALAKTVYPRSPASAAGLQDGDVIREVNGHEVYDAPTFRKTITQLAGQHVQVTIFRDGQTLTKDVALNSAH
jgi:hypothetical protein